MRKISDFDSAPAGPQSTPTGPDLYNKLADHCDLYKGADNRRSILQFTVTAVLFFAAVGMMIACVKEGFWLGYAALLLPASGLLVRLFIVQHDCGHGSYFKSRRANTLVGRALGGLTVTPYDYWRRTPNMHHAGSGNLERRGYGAIETLTIEEYKSLPLRRRLVYRLYRNAFIMLILGTPIFTIIGQRFALTEPFPFPEFARTADLKGIWSSVIGTNIAIAVFYSAWGMLVGGSALLTVYLPVLIVTAWIGGWLFYIQHQFEDTHWDQQDNWSFKEAALRGSSFYDLPPVLQWFTGNIGLHHIHHLCAMIPNYKLQECLEGHPELQTMNRMTLRDSLKCVDLALWDENRRKLVSFREAAV